MNFCALIGRLTADPEIRFAGDKKVANYTLAVDRGGDNGADFFRCSAWNGGADFAEKYLRKGMKIGVTGRMQTGSYTDQNGQRRDTFTIVVSSHDFCEKRSDSAQGSAASAQGAYTNFQSGEFTVDSQVDDNEDPLPF